MRKCHCSILHNADLCRVKLHYKKLEHKGHSVKTAFFLVVAQTQLITATWLEWIPFGLSVTSFPVSIPQTMPDNGLLMLVMQLLATSIDIGY